jgi:hypothetical protein
VLTEDVVINLLCEHLSAEGWKILSRALSDQRGTDVVDHTARFGEPFSQPQVRVHVGEAILKALAVVAAGNTRAAVAFPRGRATTGSSILCDRHWQSWGSSCSGSARTELWSQTIRRDDSPRRTILARAPECGSSARH